MKNQRRNKPKGQLKGTWDLQFKNIQQTHHTKEIGHTKTGHRKKQTVNK